MIRLEKTVFISYRRTDVYIALAAYENLKNQGYDVFFDYRSISSGDFEQIITSNIRARAHFLLILTPTALDRCNEPGDWLRREIEMAIDEKRNIIPLFFKGFRFGVPSVTEKLTGKLRNLSRYNGLNVHEDYFDEAMHRLHTQYLNVPLETVLHPVSTEVQKVVKAEQVAADKALEQIEDVKELVRQGEEKPAQKQELPKPFVLPNVPTVPWRPVTGVAVGVILIALLIWGGVNLFRNQSLVNLEPTAMSTLLPASTSAPAKTVMLPTRISTSTPIVSITITSTDAIPVAITAKSTASCYGLSFISDVTIPDNTPVAAGQAFTKTWKVKNAGSCAWDAGFKFRFAGGDSMGSTAYALPSSVAVGAEIDISVPMAAPSVPGSYRGYWRMSTANGQFFGDEMYVQIVVGGQIGTVAVPSTQSIGSKLTSEKDGMVLLYVPAGEFMMGSNDSSGEERPAHSVYLDAYWIDQTEVTNKLFSLFIDSTGYQTEAEKAGYAYVFDNSVVATVKKTGANWLHPFGSDSSVSSKDKYRENYPVTQVSWNDAVAYCEWAGRRLPTEAEWEKAARGTDQHIYPWGNSQPDTDRLNFERWFIIDGSKAVGSYPSGASPYLALDMAGNVEEWVDAWFDVYPGGNSKDWSYYDRAGQIYRVVRGGSWNSNASYVRSSSRWFASPKSSLYDRGFRCAMDATP